MSDLTSDILDVLQRLNRPAELEEISFRVRSTPPLVEEQLAKMVAAGLVRQLGRTYAINDQAKSSRFKSIYS